MKLTYIDVVKLLTTALTLVPNTFRSVYGIPRGGLVPATMISTASHKPLVESPNADTLIVDDILDSGKTMEAYNGIGIGRLVLITKDPQKCKSIYYGMAVKKTEWVSFPWEVNYETVEDNIIRILEYIGEDPKREGLLDTPKRIIKSYRELFSGYKQDPKTILSRQFTDSYDEMVVLKDIEFYSFCEHHILPFFGKVSIAYVPRGKVVGISKLARLVEVYSRRLQIQEKLTNEIAQAIFTELGAKGVAVYIKARHFCMIARGVNKQNSEMITSKLLGVLLEKPEARQEFLKLIE